MDWQPIIIDILSVTSILSIVAMVRFWKQNKQLKDNEVKINTFDTQKAQIDLGEMFTQKAADLFDRMQKLQEETYKVTMENCSDSKSIMKHIQVLNAEQTRLANEQRNIVEEQKRFADEQSHLVKFVNGEYQDFLRRNGFKK